MKTLTCKQMGGMCDQSMSANSPEEMITIGMKHLEVAHPEMMESIQSMPADHPLMVEWHNNFLKEWEKTPEDAQA